MMNSNFLTVGVLAIALLVALWTSPAGAQGSETDRIKPWTDNPRYWQYKGEPVMLLGGGKTDHIFLAEGLEEHLDEIAAVGGNYVRCTMSQREGLDLKPHRRREDGKFDLDEWNADYWDRFADCLKWCEERGMIRQSGEEVGRMAV